MGLNELAKRFEAAFDVESLEPGITPVGIKFIPKGDCVPNGFEGNEIPTPWCGAVKLASEGECILITKDNIGCPAGAIALGLVSAKQDTILKGNRKYTSLMHTPATPKDFTEGLVYACKGANHMKFALFGDADTGRYQTLGAAKNAISGMVGLDEEVMDAVLAFPAHKHNAEPDVVILGMTPKQALRCIQGYCYKSGDRVVFNTIGIRGVCADVTAYPYLKQKINASFFCLGARALSGWPGEQLTLGMPYHDFEKMIVGMEESRKGFPYKAYP